MTFLKNQMTVTSALIVTLFMMVSCASTDEKWAKVNCAKQQAYETGMSESRAGNEMNRTPYETHCNEVKGEITSFYVKGYKDGTAARLSNQLNDGAGKGTDSRGTTVAQSGMGGGKEAPQGILPLGDKTWFCGIQVGVSATYEAYGASQTEGKKNAVKLCRAEQDEKACKKVNCRRNY